MIKFYQVISLCCLFNAAYAYALDTDKDENGYITSQYALNCIQANKEMDLARQHMLAAEAEKTLLNSKVLYLQNQINKRRSLIEKLDQQHNQVNNENYNQLVTQFEELVEERRQTVKEFEIKQASYISQHRSVINLEQQFSTQCLQQIQMSEELYNEVCQYEEISWCKAFKI